jgi:macrodomain Ter protein organizer (MatP/YcbG family)
LLNTISTSRPEGVGGPLHRLARGNVEDGWKLQYVVKNRYNGADVYVYQFPSDYEDAEEIIVERE